MTAAGTFDPREYAVHRYGLEPSQWQRLSGAGIWVTGAGTGFGRAIAIAAASAGAHVFLTGRRTAKLLETIAGAEAIGASTSRCHAVPADIARSDDTARAADAIRARCRSIRGLVGCAAVPQRAGSRWPLLEEPDDYLDEILRINVRGHWSAAKAVLPHMIAAGAARVIFLTSAAGWSFAPGFGHYNVSKAALNSLTACLAAEAAARYPDADVQINALDPGQARTEMNGGSEVSPFAAVPTVLRLLAHRPKGPNGRFFTADGRSRGFATAGEYAVPLE